MWGLISLLFKNKNLRLFPLIRSRFLLILKPKELNLIKTGYNFQGLVIIRILSMEIFIRLEGLRYKISEVLFVDLFFNRLSNRKLGQDPIR